MKCTDAGFKKAWCGDCADRLVEAQPYKPTIDRRVIICKKEGGAAVTPSTTPSNPEVKKLASKKKNDGIKVSVRPLFAVGLMFTLMI
jgi:hypothetical protein